MSQGNWGGGGPPPGGGGYGPPGGAPPGSGGYGPPGGAPPGGGGYGPPPGGGGYGPSPGGGGYGPPPGGGGYGPPPGGGGYGPPPGGYGAPPSGQFQGRQETPFFTDSFVTVTSARAIFRGTTYALANITSVHCSTVKKSGSPLLLGILCLVTGLFLIIANSGSGTGTCGGVILLVGVVATIVYFVSKDQHWVRIGTAGGEVNAFGSTNAAHVNEIVAALNNAIIHRG
jgi:Family of unknown function (DUF6232)